MKKTKLIFAILACYGLCMAPVHAKDGVQAKESTAVEATAQNGNEAAGDSSAQGASEGGTSQVAKTTKEIHFVSVEGNETTKGLENYHNDGATGKQSIAIGQNATANKAQTISIGNQAALDDHMIIIGYNELDENGKELQSLKSVSGHSIIVGNRNNSSADTKTHGNTYSVYGNSNDLARGNTNIFGHKNKSYSHDRSNTLAAGPVYIIGEENRLSKDSDIFLVGQKNFVIGENDPEYLKIKNEHTDNDKNYLWNGKYVTYRRESDGSIKMNDGKPVTDSHGPDLSVFDVDVTGSANFIFAGGGNIFVNGLYNRIINGDSLDVFGSHNKVHAQHSVIVGSNNTVGDIMNGDINPTNAIALGTGNKVYKYYAVAVGQQNEAYGEKSIVLGSQNIAEDEGVENKHAKMATSIGFRNYSSADGSVSMGVYNNLDVADDWTYKSNGVYSSAVGVKNLSLGERSSAFGYENRVLSDYSAGIGFKNIINNASSYAFGGENQVFGTKSSGVGISNVVIGDNSGSYGFSDFVKGDESFAFGGRNSLYGVDSTIVGLGNKVVANGSTLIGNQSQILTLSPLDPVRNAVLLGINASTSLSDSVVLGSESVASIDAGVWGKLANGNSASTRFDNKKLNEILKDVSAAKKKLDESKGKILALYDELQKTPDDQKQQKQAEIEPKIEAELTNYTQFYATWQQAKKDARQPLKELGVPTWQGQLAAVSVGNPENGLTRQITGVAAGTNDTDAVNVAQLNAAIASVKVTAGTNIKVDSTSTSGDSSTGGTEPGTSSGTPGGSGSGTAGGTTTPATGEGVKVSLAEVVTFEGKTSENEKQTVQISKDGIELSGKTAIKMGDNKIVNLAEGKDAKDAVNVSQLGDIILGNKQPLYNDKGQLNLPNDGLGGLGESATSVDAALRQLKQQSGGGKISASADNTPKKDQQLKDVTGVKITGGAKSKLVDESVGVTVKDENGQAHFEVKVAQDLDGMNSITFGPKPADGQPDNRVSISAEKGLDNGGHKITNVAAGTAPTDAVNVGQLDSRIASSEHRMRKYANAGTASAMAAANIPQAYVPGHSALGVGLGYSHGQSALAVGVSTINDKGDWIFKGSASVNSEGGVFGAGASYMW